MRLCVHRSPVLFHLLSVCLLMASVVLPLQAWAFGSVNCINCQADSDWDGVGYGAVRSIKGTRCNLPETAISPVYTALFCSPEAYPAENDNCPTVLNVDQADADGNGVGDVCQSAAYDNDGDGSNNLEDNCPTLANADQLDPDGDGIGNPCDSDGPGKRNPVFDIGTGPNGQVTALAVQQESKILLGGEFISINGTAINRIARLNEGGLFDVTFNPGSGASSNVNAIAIQPDGKFVLGGYFTSINGISRRCIARLNADGSVDTGFDPGAGASSYVNAIAIQPDGKILLGGNFTSINGISRKYIARLNADGSVDTGFNPGAGDLVYGLALQPDGRILLGGKFTSINGISRNFIARLNADGSLDTAFNPGLTGISTVSSVRSLVVQSDGKILLAGSFLFYNDKGRIISRIARMHADGSLDGDFNPGSGANNTVHAIVIQPNGMAVIGGQFSSYNGLPANFIARIYTGDKDHDGVEDAGDWFDNAAAAMDSDQDGKPDTWLQPNPYGCAAEDFVCNGLTLDSDDDNDGIPDSFDPAPLNPNSKWSLDGSYKGSAIRESVSP